MVKELRNKFVTVTMILMVTIFALFFGISAVFNNYWNGLDIIDMLEWIAHSGIFTSEELKNSDENLVVEITDDTSPITGIVIDKKGNVIFEKVVGNKNANDIPGEIIEKISNSRDSRYKVDTYYYVKQELRDDNTLLVIMDTSSDRYPVKMIIGYVVLATCGIFILMCITIFLSKYVTEPAEQSLLREKRFISDASHELKTPLGAISINAQALQVEDNENIYLKNIISEATRMNKLIERLLTLSRLEEKKEDIKTTANLSEICEEMILTYECVAFEKRIKYIYDIENGIEIVGDEDELKQLLAILLDNAIKHTEEMGKIIVRCKKNRNHTVLEVANTGVGIASEDLPHLFERFYTSDISRKENSFGLGLSIAKAIVDRHHGEISVKDEEDGYTIFEVEF